MDSKEPDWSKFHDFLGREVRYTSLEKAFPEESEGLYAAAKVSAQWRYRSYQRMLAADYSVAQETIATE